MKKKTILKTAVTVLLIVFCMGCIVDFAPEYKTIEHRDPIYETLASVELDDLGDGKTAVVYTNVYDVEKTYTGSDFWGNDNYNVVIFYYAADQKTSILHREVNRVRLLDTYERITGYKIWTERVRVS